MNRHERRMGRVCGPEGEWLYPTLLHVIGRDKQGRPTHVRIAYDDEKIGDVVGDDSHPKMLLVWMPENRPS